MDVPLPPWNETASKFYVSQAVANRILEWAINAYFNREAVNEALPF
ncbi:MAG: hypothetical protein IT440_00970 [Phycisphaeraceae bacterium]|nr:hypothetical protein [Phycisphaeraceae bacterium]